MQNQYARNFNVLVKKVIEIDWEQDGVRTEKKLVRLS